MPEALATTAADPQTITDMIVVGASAGGVEALRGFCAGLPADLAAPVAVVLHIPRDAPSALASILNRSGPLPAVTATHGLRMRNGTVYVAPSDHHLLVADGHLHLSRGPAENGHRPAVDALFRSAGIDFGSHTIGVVLSGTRDDGTAGLEVIVRQGGVAMVQEPSEAMYPAMPRSVIDHLPGTQAMPVAKLGAAVSGLLGPRQTSDHPPDDLALIESDIAAAVADVGSTAELDEASPSPLSCPDCDGVLFELPGAPEPRFRCRVGHAWSPGSLAARQGTHVDNVLWAALRALEEKAALQRWMAQHAEQTGRARAAAGHRRTADQSRTQASLLRRMLTQTLPDE